MSTNTEEIFVSLKKNGFDISLLELEKILALMVKEEFIRTEISSGSRDKSPYCYCIEKPPQK
jgi:hypothetical protein